MPDKKPVKEQIKCGENIVPGPKQIPSLISRQQRKCKPSWRILQRLANGGLPATTTASSRGWNIDSWTIGLGMLVAVVCSASWYMQTQPKAMPHAAKVAPPVPAPLAASSAPDSVVIAPTPQPAAVARIINAATTDRPHHSDPPPMPSSTAQSKPERNISARRSAHRVDPGKLVIPAERAKESSDSDAALLAALVAHASHPPTAAGINRDIVERHANAPTAPLLARCQQLGLIEGMLCRSRICADRWDSDAACRQPASPPHTLEPGSDPTSGHELHRN